MAALRATAAASHSARDGLTVASPGLCPQVGEPHLQHGVRMLEVALIQRA